MTRTLSIALLSTLLLTACAQKQTMDWVHPEGLDAATLEQAKSECDRMAEEATGSSTYGKNVKPYIRTTEEAFPDGMKEKGWIRVDE